MINTNIIISFYRNLCNFYNWILNVCDAFLLLIVYSGFGVSKHAPEYSMYQQTKVTLNSHNICLNERRMRGWSGNLREVSKKVCVENSSSKKILFQGARTAGNKQECLLHHLLLFYAIPNEREFFWFPRNERKVMKIHSGLPANSFIIQDSFSNEILKDCLCFVMLRLIRMVQKRLTMEFLPLDYQLIFPFNAQECGPSDGVRRVRGWIYYVLFYHQIGLCSMISHGWYYL